MATETKQKRRAATAGFTLVELMVVVSIIAVLATIVGMNVFRALDDADRTTAQAQITNLKSAVKMYMMKNRKLPNSLEEVVEFLDPQEIPVDPWGNPYNYTKTGSREYTIVSYGADGSPGGSDIDADISSGAV